MTPPTLNGHSHTIHCNQISNLYPLCLTSHVAADTHTLENLETTITVKWHHYLGHPHYQAMKNIKKFHLLEALKDNFCTVEPCTSCILGKRKAT